ncbi:MAG: alpha/beta hydrolase [Bacteroidota bacterium]
MSRSIALSIILSFLFTIPSTFCQISSEPFEFQFENKTLRGLIEKPTNQTSQAVIIIIPGYGETNFVEGNWYSRLREKLVSYGLTVCLWDKMGCGNSEGVFNAQQPVENSAEEAIAAIQQLKKLNSRYGLFC